MSKLQILTTYQLPKRLVEDALAKADADLRAKHEAGLFDDGDPNHPKYNGGINYTRCVGLTWADIRAKQRKL